jgi:hypothetical protein
VFAGADGAATTAVGLEAAVPDPPLFAAVTTTRIAKPASLLDNE